VVRITGDIQQERVLHPAATSLLTEFFSKGWPDPAKLNNSSRQASILQEQVRQSFAKALNVRGDEIEFLGEPDLGFQLAIQGLLTPDNKLFYSSIDRQRVFAVAAYEKNKGRDVTQLQVNNLGQIQESSINANDLLIWQVANGETGNTQPSPKSAAMVFADCTSSGVDLLPNFDYQTALFDSTSWAGPAGLGILIIKSASKWRNPLPHNDLARTPGTYSLPLLLASAVALENFSPKESEIRSFNSKIRNAISERNPNAKIAGDLELALPHLLSVVFPGTNGEEILRQLTSRGISVDSGSACTAMNLQPSHVLAAMGFPTDGNVRITLHSDVTESEVGSLITELLDVVRSQ